MIPYIGDFAEDEEIYHYFNTFDSNDPSSSVTITNLADTDIYVYKDGSVTDLVTDGATVVIDFDSRTGVHKITIDTSAHADYSTGSDYMVLVEGTTVDAGTVTAALFTFSIQNRYSAGALRPTTPGRTLDVTATGAAGIDWGNVENKTTANDLSGTDIQLADTVTTVTGGATSAAQTTAQNDLDLITGTDGATLATAQALYAPAKAGDNMGAVSSVTGNVDGSVGSVVADVNADVVKISTSATAADNLEASALGIITGVAAAGTLTTTTMTSTLTGAYADDELIGRVIVWTGGTAAGQAATVTDYANTGETFTYSTIITAPIAGDSFVVV